MKPRSNPFATTGHFSATLKSKQYNRVNWTEACFDWWVVRYETIPGFVHPLVCWSVSPSPLNLSAFLRSLASLLQPKCFNDLKFSPFPHACYWGSRVSSLILSKNKPILFSFEAFMSFWPPIWRPSYLWGHVAIYGGWRLNLTIPQLYLFGKPYLRP